MPPTVIGSGQALLVSSWTTISSLRSLMVDEDVPQDPARVRGLLALQLWSAIPEASAGSRLTVSELLISARIGSDAERIEAGIYPKTHRPVGTRFFNGAEGE